MLKDEFGFLENVGDWCNHRPLLLLALDITKHSINPVLELGMGKGSSFHLLQYCEKHGRTLYSYDFNKEWYDEISAQLPLYDLHTKKHVASWQDSTFDQQRYSVCLIDESPGEARKDNITRLKHKVDVFVAHDTQPAADHGYQMSQVISTFKYISHTKTDGAWTTIFSDTYSFDQFIGTNIGKDKNTGLDFVIS